MDKIIIETKIKSPIEKVWDYYTEPEHIVNWNFASDDWFCPTADNDLRVGGRYFARMEAKDGSFGFDFEGIYQDIEKPNYLIYKLSDEREVKVVFKEISDETAVFISFDPEKINPIDLQEKGWQAILNNFKKYVETK